jgi:hypothetical protein
LDYRNFIFPVGSIAREIDRLPIQAAASVAGPQQPSAASTSCALAKMTSAL